MVIESSKDLFRIHILIWKFGGCIYPKEHRILYFTWSFAFNFGVTFLYPLHLILGLFQAKTKDEIFKSLAVNLLDIVCSLKFVIFWYNLKNVRFIENTFASLDERMQTNDEKIYFQKVVQTCKKVFYVVAVIFSGSLFTSELTTFMGAQKRLMYPAWLPFDWRKSLTHYWIANMYQFIGVAMQIVINYGSTTYTPVCLATLSGHLRLLGIRMSKLGTDRRKSCKENNKELRACIKDHKKLIEIYYVLNKVISMGMFFGILCTGFNICCTIMYLAFFADNVFAVIYYLFYFMLVAFEIFPSCYFGSVFETEFNNLPYALFSCNWIDQDREFKQNIIIFSQRGFQETVFLCMGFFKINLDSFFFTMRSAYSLFAVLMQTK